MSEIKAAARLIEAMSFTRSVAESKITGLGNPFYEHVVEVFLFPDSNYVDHWLKELVGWYYQIQTIGLNLKKGRAFSPAEFASFLTERHRHRPAESFTALLDVLIAHNADIPHAERRRTEVGDSELHHRISRFYHFMAEYLATDRKWDKPKAELLRLAKLPTQTE